MRHLSFLLGSLALLLAACAGDVVAECGTETCPDPNAECIDTEAGPECRCMEGTVDEGDGCQAPNACTDSTCTGRGLCSEVAGGVACVCDAGFGGALCERCADGFHDDGVGGCSDDPCTPNPCGSDRTCSVIGGTGVCGCPAGMHDEAGICVDDTECLASSCNARGTCADDGGVVVCMCETGWAGDACDRCDSDAGYHDDGTGECTMDACLPNPCTSLNQSICVVEPGGLTRCDCDPGTHFEGVVCVPDEVCVSSSCSGRGTCAVVDGRVACICDAGSTGPACAMCDTAGGYHDDGAGGCTMDACLPDPCTTVPNRTVCSSVGTVASCSCDAGFHDDGVGGCTTDVCVPDPCAALGQSCRDMGGVAECYTPVCDDMNPCTTDAPNAVGVCVFTPLGDGTSCSTTLCTSGQQCTAGLCGGGATVSCDDTNPCTTDSCDALTGCMYVDDDSVVPDDGFACTLDSCASGVEGHVPNDAICEDGLWCTGVDSCVPTDPSANAAGCIGVGVPVAPGPDSVCGSWVCNDAAMRFDQVVASAGMSCDDTILCTTSDQCDGSGGCAGTVTPACDSGAGCSTTVPWSSAVDVAPARLLGRLLYAGSETFPDATSSTGLTIYLRARDTDIEHQLEGVSFEFIGPGPYPVRTTSARNDRVIDLPVMPGVYDVVYRRFGTLINNTFITSHDPADSYAHAIQVLQRGLVIGPGTTSLDIDVAPSRVTGRLLYGGSTTFPDATSSAGLTIYLRSRDTGIRHQLEGVSFEFIGPGPYPVRTTSARDDRTIDLPVMPGVYDIVYRRFGTLIDDTYITSHDPADNYAHAIQYLGSVTVGAGTTTLDVDVAPGRLSGSLLYSGSTTFPDATSSTGATVYLRSRDTGIRHQLEGVSFEFIGPGPYPVRTTSARNDRVIDLPMMPGVYDIVYRRFGTLINDTFITSHDPSDNYAHAVQYIGSVTVGTGTTTLDVEIAPGRLSGALLYGGSTTFPDATSSTGATVYLRSRDTGIQHQLEGVSFEFIGPGPYPVRTTSARNDRVIDLPMMPGVYDIIYRRFGTLIDDTYITSHDPADNYAHAIQTIGFVTIGAGTTALDVEVAPGRLSGSLLYTGSTTFPDASSSTGATVYLRSRETGIQHQLEGISFEFIGAGPYPVRTTSARNDRVIDLPMMPGVYDVVYRRFGTLIDDTFITSHDPDDAYAHAIRYVGVVTVGAAATPLDVEVAPSPLGGQLVYATSTTFPDATSSTGATIYLRARDTGIQHQLEGVSFEFIGPGPYPVRTTSARNDRLIDLPVMPGTYDVIYRRFGTLLSDTYITSHDPADNYAHAIRAVSACVQIP